MNCKPGDLAIIVNADCEWNYRDVGKIVHVIDRDAIDASALRNNVLKGQP